MNRKDDFHGTAPELNEEQLASVSGGSAEYIANEKKCAEERSARVCETCSDFEEELVFVNIPQSK